MNYTIYKSAIVSISLFPSVNQKSVRIGMTLQKTQNDRQRWNNVEKAAKIQFTQSSTQLLSFNNAQSRINFLKIHLVIRTRSRHLDTFGLRQVWMLIINVFC